MYYKYWADNIPIFTLSTIFTVLVDSQCVFSWVCSADTQESKDCCLIPLFILHIAHTNTKCYITAVTQLYFDYAIFLYCIISLVDWMDGWWMVEWGIEGSPFVFQRYRNTKCNVRNLFNEWKWTQLYVCSMSSAKSFGTNKSSQ